jgi:outer membrane lipoprotein SlyB
MYTFCELTDIETMEIEAGGFLSAVAGTIAFGMIGFIVGVGVAVITGDEDAIAQGTIAGGAAGLWIGLGAPLP